MLEEVTQYFADKQQYFTRLSNRMDGAMYILLAIYFVLRLFAWGFESQALFYAFTDTLIVATIACFLRGLNVFAFSKSLGPLFFVITRLFKDVGQWFFIFVLFMFSFQAGIFALTEQVGKSGWEFFPSGSMGAGFTAILGDLGDNTMDWMTETRGFGVVLLLAYSLITQVMLVNLLIAMMNDTYSKVKENSDKEWKFYRYCLIVDYITNSPYPPPFNLVFGPYFYIKQWKKEDSTKAILTSLIKRKNDTQQFYDPNDTELELLSDQIVLKMKQATETVIEEEKIEDQDTLQAVSRELREHMRILNTQRDSDRFYLQLKMEAILNEVKANKCKCQCQYQSNTNSNNNNDTSNTNDNNNPPNNNNSKRSTAPADS